MLLFFLLIIFLRRAHRDAAVFDILLRVQRYYAIRQSRHTAPLMAALH